MRQVFLIAAMLLSVATPSLAQEQLKVGNSYSGNIKLSSPNTGIYLALPEGIWVLTSLEESRSSPSNAPLLNGRLVSTDDQKRVVGFVSFTTGNGANSKWVKPD